MIIFGRFGSTNHSGFFVSEARQVCRRLKWPAGLSIVDRLGKRLIHKEAIEIRLPNLPCQVVSLGFQLLPFFLSLAVASCVQCPVRVFASDRVIKSTGLSRWSGTLPVATKLVEMGGIEPPSSKPSCYRLHAYPCLSGFCFSEPNGTEPLITAPPLFYFRLAGERQTIQMIDDCFCYLESPSNRARPQPEPSKNRR